MNEVGTKIRKLRELKDYTQEYMASSLGITQSTYAKIEKNETPISLSRLDEIAKVLEIDPLNILTFDKEQVINNNYYAKVQYGPYIDQRQASAAQLEDYQQQITSLQTQLENLHALIMQMTKTT